MNWDAIQILSGTMSSIIFASGTMAMLVKAWKTHDFSSYSFSSLLLYNIGNTMYWLYIISLPVGPIYFLHSFSTIATLVMFVSYWFSQTQRVEEQSGGQPWNR